MDNLICSPKMSLTAVKQGSLKRKSGNDESLPRIIPAFHRALLAQIPKDDLKAWSLVTAYPVPSLGPGQVLIKTSHVGLNPYDWQGVAFRFAIGPEAKVMGRDGAGIVVAKGSDVTRYDVGDRVWFSANATKPSSSAFQEYSVHSAAEVGRTPSSISDAEAATLGTGLITAGVALFRTLGLSFQDLGKETEERPWILIWGGAGITGVYLIQLAKLLGYRVICAASPVNTEYVTSLGAEVVLDRWKQPEELVEAIREATNDQVSLAVDNVGKQTAALCDQVLRGSAAWRKSKDLETDAQGEGRLVALAGSPSPSETDDAVRTVTYPRISFSTTFYDHPEFSAPLLDRFSDLLEENTLLPARIRFLPGGLEGIERGLDDLRHGRTTGGYKLVSRLYYSPAEPEAEPRRVAASTERSKRVRITA